MFDKFLCLLQFLTNYFLLTSFPSWSNLFKHTDHISTLDTLTHTYMHTQRLFNIYVYNHTDHISTLYTYTHTHAHTAFIQHLCLQLQFHYLHYWHNTQLTTLIHSRTVTKTNKKASSWLIDLEGWDTTPLYQGIAFIPRNSNFAHNYTTYYIVHPCIVRVGMNLCPGRLCHSSAVPGIVLSTQSIFPLNWHFPIIFQLHNN